MSLMLPFSAVTETSLQQFRSHRCHLHLTLEDLRQFSPQTLGIFEFRNQRELGMVLRAYKMHLRFGDGLMQSLGLRFRREFDMGNRNFLFRTRDWLRKHGCVREAGETWRAAS